VTALADILQVPVAALAWLRVNCSALEFERYEWFLPSMLVMIHFVTRMKTNDPFWKALTTNQISYHWQYIERFWPAPDQAMVDGGNAAGCAGLPSPGSQ
jgi:hypothetical protein